MNKYLTRIVALLLVPCLVADPGLCSNFANSPASGLTSPVAFIQQQALTARLGWVGPNTWRTITSKIQELVGQAVRPVRQAALASPGGSVYLQEDANPSQGSANSQSLLDRFEAELIRVSDLAARGPAPNLQQAYLLGTVMDHDFGRRLAHLNLDHPSLEELDQLAHQGLLLMIQRGRALCIILTPRHSEIQSGDIQQDTWRQIPYLKGWIYSADLSMRPGSQGIGAFSIDEFAFMDPVIARRDALKTYPHVMRLGSVGDPLLNAIGHWAQKVQLKDREYAELFGVNRLRQEEIAHSKDHVFTALRMGGNPLKIQAPDIAAAILRPESKLHHYRPEIPTQPLLINVAIGELSAHLQGIIAEIEHLTQKTPSRRTEDLSYTLFLEFLGNEWSRHEGSKTRAHHFYDVMGGMFFSGIADQGFASSEDLIKNLEAGPQHPALAALDFLKRLYRMDFYDDDERAQLLEQSVSIPPIAPAVVETAPAKKEEPAQALPTVGSRVRDRRGRDHVVAEVDQSNNRVRFEEDGPNTWTSIKLLELLPEPAPVPPTTDDDKSLSHLSPSAVNKAIEQTIHEGNAVAIQFRAGWQDYYFGPLLDDETRATRLQEAFIDRLRGDASTKLQARLGDARNTETLIRALKFLEQTLRSSEWKDSLLSRRYVMILGDHPDFTAAQIVGHAGSQQRTFGYGMASIYIPLDLVFFVMNSGEEDLQHDLQLYLEHENGHLRRSLEGWNQRVVIGGHDYSSDDEFSSSQLLWGAFYRHQRLALQKPAHGLTLKAAIRRIEALAKLGVINAATYDLFQVDMPVILIVDVVNQVPMLHELARVVRQAHKDQPSQDFAVQVVNEGRYQSAGAILNFIPGKGRPLIDISHILKRPRFPGTGIVAARLMEEPAPDPERKSPRGLGSMTLPNTYETWWRVFRWFGHEDDAHRWLSKTEKACIEIFISWWWEFPLRTFSPVVFWQRHSSSNYRGPGHAFFTRAGTFFASTQKTVHLRRRISFEGYWRGIGTALCELCFAGFFVGHILPGWHTAWPQNPVPWRQILSLGLQIILVSGLPHLVMNVINRVVLMPFYKINAAMTLKPPPAKGYTIDIVAPDRLKEQEIALQRFLTSETEKRDQDINAISDRENVIAHINALIRRLHQETRHPHFPVLILAWSTTEPHSLVGARVLMHPGGDRVTGIDVVALEQQRGGIGSDLRIASFKWMIQHGYYKYRAWIKPSDTASRRALEKACVPFGIQPYLESDPDDKEHFYAVDLPHTLPASFEDEHISDVILAMPAQKKLIDPGKLAMFLPFLIPAVAVGLVVLGRFLAPLSYLTLAAWIPFIPGPRILRMNKWRDLVKRGNEVYLLPDGGTSLRAYPDKTSALKLHWKKAPISMEATLDRFQELAWRFPSSLHRLGILYGEREEYDYIAIPSSIKALDAKFQRINPRLQLKEVPGFLPRPDYLEKVVKGQLPIGRTLDARSDDLDHLFDYAYFLTEGMWQTIQEQGQVLIECAQFIDQKLAASKTNSPSPAKYREINDLLLTLQGIITAFQMDDGIGGLSAAKWNKRALAAKIGATIFPSNYGSRRLGDLLLQWLRGEISTEKVHPFLSQVQPVEVRHGVEQIYEEYARRSLQREQFLKFPLDLDELRELDVRIHRIKQKETVSPRHIASWVREINRRLGRFSRKTALGIFLGLSLLMHAPKHTSSFTLLHAA